MWLALLGGALAAVGTVPPWIVTAPGQQVVPAIYLPGMETGIRSHDYPVLGILVVGLAAAFHGRHRRRGGYLAAATGALVVLVSGLVVFAMLDGFVGTFVPGPGVALSVAGGLLLASAGWGHLVSHPDGVGVDPERAGRV